MRKVFVGPRMIVVAMAVAAVIAGCGGGGSSKSVTSPTTASADAAGPGSDDFCGLIRTYSDRLAGIVQPSSTPAQIKTFAKDVESAMKSALAVAPAEIKSDTTLVAGAADNYLAALKSADYDPAKLSPDALEGFQAPDVAAAATRFQAYAQDVCGTRS